MIVANSLSKHYGPRVAVDSVSFEVGAGELVGFLGPNGAGKTTTMRVLTGYLPASGGTAVVAGHDVFEAPMEVKRRVGYLPESPPLYPELSVGDYLSFCAELRGFRGAERLRRIGAVMERVGLDGWERRVLGTLSKGYRQRVGLAQALLHDPPVLILDEPTSGLDPTQLLGIREVIRSLAGTHTVVLSSHFLSEVEALCPRVLVISRGRLLADGTIEEIRSRATGGRWTHVELRGVDAKALGGVPGVLRVEPVGEAGGWQEFRVRAEGEVGPELARFAAERKLPLRSLGVRLPTLEEAFIDIVGGTEG